MTDKCEICGDTEQLYATWYLEEYSTLCFLCECKQFNTAPVEDLFNRAFQPEDELSKRTAERYISHLRTAIDFYRRHGAEMGDSYCQQVGIAINDK